MIEGVIFDMDGVIIDSEPLWTEAQKEVFTSIGVNYDEKLALNTVGARAYDTIDFWYRQQPWKDISYKEIEDRIMARMTVLVEQKGKLMEGLINVLEFMKNKGLKIGLASGSPYPMIEHILTKFGIIDYFDAILSAETEEFGKPHPSVFLETAKRIKVLPLNCLVIEDSFNGLIAAKSARMKAIGFFPNGEFNNTRFDFIDLKLKSFLDFNESQFTYLQNII